MFSGVNVPSKAFGEFVEHRYETPRLAAAEVKALLDAGRNLVIVDSRPFEEYQRMNIPTATDMPGAELVYRIHDIAPDPRNTRGGELRGADPLDHRRPEPDQCRHPESGRRTEGRHHGLASGRLRTGAWFDPDAPRPGADGIDRAIAAAARVAERFGVPKVKPEVVEQWQQDPGRTTYLLDVRSPAEYADGHLPGYRNAPGGQLVQATDEYVAVRNAWLVLADDVGVRATMTASWLIQMGWQNVYVLDGGIGSDTLQTGRREPTVLGEMGAATITTDTLAGILDRVTVIDLGSSTSHERHHIPGAWWCVRARLAAALASVPASSARRAHIGRRPAGEAGIARRLERSRARDVQALDGGTNRWLAEQRAIESGLEHVIGETDDVWYKPYEHRGAQEKFMRDYLTWEVALVEQIERDGTDAVPIVLTQDRREAASRRRVTRVNGTVKATARSCDPQEQAA